MRSLINCLLILLILTGYQYNPRPRAAVGGGSDLDTGVTDCNQTGSLDDAVTTSLATTAGSTVVVGVFYTTIGGGFENVTGSVDTWPTGWTQIGTTQTLSSAFGEARLYYKENITGGSQTFTINATNEFTSLCVVEITGAGAPALEAGSATTDGTTPYTGSALTIGVADTMRIAFLAYNSTGSADSNVAETGGYTLEGEEINCGAVGCIDIWSKSVSDTGTHNVSATDTDAGGAAVFLAAIKD